jgi:hypothetical protein
MSSANIVPNRWDEDAYGNIERARCDWDGTVLTVDFENGDRVQLDPRRLLPRGINLDDISWWRIASNEMEVLIPIDDNEWFEVPWDVIRDLTDPEFSADWTRREKESSERHGQRIRELRLSQGLTLREVADRAGVSIDDVAMVEAGTHDHHFDDTPILSALGVSRADFYVSEEENAEIAVSRASISWER